MPIATPSAPVTFRRRRRPRAEIEPRARNVIARALVALLLVGGPIVAAESAASGPRPDSGRIRASLTREFATEAAEPPRLHRGPLAQALEPLLIQQARHLVSTLQPWPRAVRAERLPQIRGAASGEHGIRPNAHTAKGLALIARLLPDSAFTSEFSRADARQHAVALLRTLVLTHGAGGEVCDDGRAWRGQWQSAYWAALAGEACWLLWDELDDQEKGLAARMIADEAERFADATPPTALAEDSKGEENAWNSQILSLAGVMFPLHSRAAAWRTAATRWMASSFARPSDLRGTDLVDGRPRRDWIAGANLHDDFTLENHHRVHPDYMACTYLLTSQVPLYAWGGRPPPAALHLNVESINGVLKRLALPDGAWLYPNGQDWGLRRNIDWFEYHTALAVLYDDPQSAALQRQCLAVMQRMAARNPTGALYRPEEIRLSSDQAMALELPAHAYALMRQRGEGPAPTALPRLLDELSGRHVFAAGRFGALRTPTAIASFSWGAQVMGQVMPLQENQLLAPESRGLIGHVGTEALTREIPVVRSVAVAPFESALGVAGVLDRGGGAVEQRFAFLALPDGRTLYADVLRLTREVRPTLLDLGTLGVLNDLNWPAHAGRRVLAYEGGTRTFSAAAAASEAPVEFHSPWFNLEGLGIVCLAVSAGQRYVPKPTGAAGRLEQRFHLNAVPAARLAAAAPGAILAHSVIVFYPGQDAAGTRAAAARCTLQSRPGADVVRLTLDDATVVTLDLAQSRIEWNRPQ